MTRSRHPLCKYLRSGDFWTPAQPPRAHSARKSEFVDAQEENARPPRPTRRTRSYPVYAAAHAPPSATASHRAPPAHKERSGAGGWKVGAGP